MCDAAAAAGGAEEGRGGLCVYGHPQGDSDGGVEAEDGGSDGVGAGRVPQCGVEAARVGRGTAVCGAEASQATRGPAIGGAVGGAEESGETERVGGVEDGPRLLGSRRLVRARACVCACVGACVCACACMLIRGGLNSRLQPA